MNPPKTTKAWTQLEWGHTCRKKGQNEQAATYYQTARRLFRAEECQKGLFAGLHPARPPLRDHWRPRRIATVFPRGTDGLLA